MVCLGRFTPPLRIREQTNLRPEGSLVFSGILYVVSLEYFLLMLQKVSFDTKGNLEVIQYNPMFCFIRNTCCTTS
jgi:hypothetical protein